MVFWIEIKEMMKVQKGQTKMIPVDDDDKPGYGEKIRTMIILNGGINLQ